MTPKLKKKKVAVSLEDHVSQDKASCMTIGDPEFILLISLTLGLPFTPLLAESDINPVPN